MYNFIVTHSYKLYSRIEENKMKELSYFDLAKETLEDLFAIFKSSKVGLSTESADERLEVYGENTTEKQKDDSLLKLIIKSFLTPFTLVLIVLSVISFITEYVLAPVGEKDALSALIILFLVILSGTVSLIQDKKSSDAAKKLESIVEVTSDVCRDGKFSEIPTEFLVPGDVVRLAAGDMIPADMRLIQSKDLFVSQTSLTGESYPVEKRALATVEKIDQETSYETLCFTGSEVVSGSAIGLVVRTGMNTLFGSIAEELSRAPVKTSFDKGIENTSKLLIRFMLIMAPSVILINGITKGDWLQALLFGISVAVGLTPEMLPMIVTTNLVKGAIDMAKRGTIIRKLNAMQNFGAIDVLCTDKTGTLTHDKIVLEYHLGIDGKSNQRVLRHAYLNSYYQTGLRNLLDIAIVEAANEELDTASFKYEKVDEIPFDFQRRRMSVVVANREGKTQMITKGAIEEMLSISSFVDHGNDVRPLTEEERQKVLATVDELNSQGLRVLGVAQKTNPPAVGEFSVKDESEMVLIGYLAFLDPPKETTSKALEALHEHHVDVKVLTGDNALVTKAVCEQVGIEYGEIIQGEQLLGCSEEELREIARTHNVFVKLNPGQKAALVRALRDGGHVVGFLGDGINDSPAMRAADVAISVDNAVDIAKESADVILLEKDLMVLEEGIVSGREVFGNIMKYIKATTSSNFGNIFALLLASICLPFLPMTPIQLLFLNLVYDISCMSIPWDKMDKEYLRQPKKWNASSIKDFMIWFGPTSSIFDITTFIILFFVLIPSALGGTYSSFTEAGQEHFESLFHTGWFIMSLWTQTLVLYALRTRKLPFVESRPSFIMATITLLGIFVGTLIPFTHIGSFLELTILPNTYWILLASTVAAYLVLVTIVKKIYTKRFGELL
ncbi:magnesium-translocating P-type ATPase [Treponema phagedenis]|uniref:magnesium-translocating P-type ATPase n=1 Tax=Treponema phagedenis TaxID=162 RepID=UPI0025A9FBB8|nr:magnesium-translocating P-type ATPase [Treponema phagedenis]